MVTLLVQGLLMQAWEEKKEGGKLINKDKHCIFLCYIKFSKHVGNCITSSTSDFVKPHVEEIIATEETPDPNEIPIVEEEDDAEGNKQAVRVNDMQSAAAKIVLYPTESLERQEEKSVETNG